MYLFLSLKFGGEIGRSVLHNKSTEPGMWDRASLYLLEKAWLLGLAHERLGEYKLICYRFMGPGGKFPSETCKTN